MAWAWTIHAASGGGLGGATAGGAGGTTGGALMLCTVEEYIVRN